MRRDIVAELHLVDPAVLVGPFDRPNLVYRVRRRGDLPGQLRRVLDRHRGEAGIVYCISRKDVEQLAARLEAWGVAARPYHAGLGDEVRARHQEEFATERVDVMVATVAFGMGIDRSDVRFVVHAAAPRSLEHYQQEAGRAGRDGLEAECVLLWSHADLFAWRRLLAASGELGESAEELLAGMRRYAATPGCRHRALVEYFGQSAPRDGCGACDHCLGELDDHEPLDDALVVAQKVLSCVVRVGQRFGAGHVTDVLRGLDNEKVRRRGHQELSTFGLLAESPAAEVRGFLDQLLDQGYLEQDGDRFPVLRVTGAGRRVLSGGETPRLYRELRPAARRAAASSRPEDDAWEGVDRDLFEALRALRREIARERGVPPYVLFHDSTLREMARLRPTTEPELLAVRGVGERKARDLGPRVLPLIAAHPG